MCGIVGLSFNHKSNQAITEDHQRRMQAALQGMSRRGPDGSGICSGSNWLLGHVRLAILDPKAGQQPWQCAQTGTTLTYNGEIFNFREIREKLSQKGHEFKTQCDTEVVLKAYLEWGPKCLTKFNGFFALAIYDPSRDTIFAARDRIGIKPFYYAKQEDSFCFGSTIPAITASSRLSPDLNLPAVSHYLSTGKTVFGEQTLFKQINLLRPGHHLTYSLKTGKLQIKRYWQRPILSAQEKADMAPSFEEAVATTAELLEDSVKKRLISDVPLGSFLSGGVDSAIIAANAFKHSSQPVPLFCAGTDDDKLNEFNYARIMAQQLNADLSEIVITPTTFANDWSFLMAEKGQPLSTPNEISIYHLAKALRKQCTVTLTGEGADEIFGGYIQPQFSAFDFDRCSHDPDNYDDSSSFALAMIMLYGRSFFINDTDHYIATASWFTYLGKCDLFQQSAWHDLEEDNDLFEFYESFFNSIDKCSSFDKRMHLYAEFNLENLLLRVDNSTMAASVEARVPFNDHRLVEHAFKMPDGYKMDWRSAEAQANGQDLTAAAIDHQDLLESKRLPRNAFKNMLPTDIIDRKKMSFPVPFTSWFTGPMLEHVTDVCMNSQLTADLFNRDHVDLLLKTKHRNLWLLANLCKWHNEIIPSLIS